MQWASKVSAIAEQARGLTLEAAQSVGSRYTTTGSADDSRSFDFAKALDARSDREKIDGMQRLLVLSARGEDMSVWFASVVKNVASSSLELRKLVYLYITRYAESQPDLALLSINTIQKALSDQNQLVRALALRVMTSIRVPSISGIALLAIKRCQADSSFYVRKTAAMALVKTYALDPTLQKQLLDILKILLADDDAAVFCSAVEAYEALASDRVELLHPHYRRACGMLSQMDEFGQVNVLRVLVRYARTCFTSPSVEEPHKDEADFYSEETTRSARVEADLALLLRSVENLLYSSSSAVILAASQAIQHLGVPADLNKLASPLVAQLRQPAEIRQIVLANIAVLCLDHATIFSPFAKHFLVYPGDAQDVWTLKLEILTLLITESNAALVLGELEQYSKDETNVLLSCAAIRAIGQCAQRQPMFVASCVDLLFSHLQSANSARIAEAVLSLRLLIQLNPTEHLESTKKLLRSLDDIVAPAARACIFWLAAEQATLLPRVVPDVLRIGVKHFAKEHESVRLQIVILAVKLYTLHSPIMPMADSRVPQLYAHLMHLCRYDTSYDLRDRLRTYKVLASS
ncbi:Clathrin/coatomer adaptor, adaptin-like protein, partial [Protomyces lactucae-debilis]